jgi:Permuted papain-like amidase enzyme, YaeF/YiiX, C92 family
MVRIPRRRFPDVDKYPYRLHARKLIRTGDILLAQGRRPFSKLIQKFTKSVWSHVGIFAWLSDFDRLLVLESVESQGVRAMPFSKYLGDYQGGKPYPGRLLVARHEHFQHVEDDTEAMVRFGRVGIDHLAYPYDKDEIARIAWRLVFNRARQPVEDNEYICSEFAYKLLEAVAVDVPYNKFGFIAPADFARCEWVKPIMEVI